jgi:hypothetical protein
MTSKMSAMTSKMSRTSIYSKEKICFLGGACILFGKWKNLFMVLLFWFFF